MVENVQEEYSRFGLECTFQPIRDGPCFISHFDSDKWLILSVAEGSSASSGIRSLRIGRYTYNEIGGTWNDARKACKKERAHLLTLETTAEWKETPQVKVAGDHFSSFADITALQEWIE